MSFFSQSPNPAPKSSDEKPQKRAHETMQDLRQYFQVQTEYSTLEQEGTNPAVYASAKEAIDKIKAQYKSVQKSNLQDASILEEYSKLYLTQPIILLAKSYNDQLSQPGSNIENLKENFAHELKEYTTLTIRYIQEYAKEGPGFIDSEGTAKFVEESARFRYMLMSDQAKPLRKALSYGIRGQATQEEGDQIIKDISGIVLDTYTGDSDKKIVDALAFTIQQLKTSDKLELIAQFKQHATPQQLESFLQDANKFGALSLGQMEESRGAKYSSEEQRQQFNDNFTKKETIRTNMRIMRGSYGSKNIFDKSFAQTALILGDVWAVSTFALNTGIGIFKGAPFPVYSQISAAYLAGRHLTKGNTPILRKLGLEQNSPKVQAAQQAKFELQEFHDNTLAFEDWNSTFNDGGVQILHDFGDYLTDHGKKAFPNTIEVTQLKQFLLIENTKAQDPARKALLDKFQENFNKISESSKSMPTLLKITRIFQYFPIQEDKKGIHNLEEFNIALASIIA